MSSAASTHGGALRRYPALAWLAGAVALALLLPSGLNVPNAGPSSLAEYAPVPGAGDGASPVAELGLSSSQGGAGAGGGFGAAAAEPPEPAGATGARIVRKPGTKRCVGNPPRQTEDPLSPPCVAFFEGDNFGATAKGVTADEAQVVMEIDACGRTDPNCRTLVDCDDGPAPDDTAGDTLCKAFARYFNDRYQTYGRRIHLWANHDLGAEEVDALVSPFAVLDFSSSPTWSRRGSMSVGYSPSARAVYAANAPRLMTFRPDLEDMAQLAASFVCDKLAGRPARFSREPGDQTRTRRFALYSAQGNAYREHLESALAERCGIHPEAAFSGSDATQPARLRSAGVTTVIDIASLGNDVSFVQFAAQSGWFPEWVVPGGDQLRSNDTNFYGRLNNQAEWANAIGITFDYRRDRIEDQHWHRAFREACPDCPEPDAVGASGATMHYDALMLFFTGVQAAGPRLTVANVDKGLHAIPPNGSPDPYKPAAYFSPGNHTFVKDAAAIWWDPTGVAPGSSQTGCYRLVDDGRRRRAGEWPAGDADLRVSGPCQGDSFRA